MRAYFSSVSAQESQMARGLKLLENSGETMKRTSRTGNAACFRTENPATLRDTGQTRVRVHGGRVQKAGQGYGEEWSHGALLSLW